METTPSPTELTADRIRALLAMGPDAVALPEYQRLLEIYCVVKAGGLAAQVAVIQRLETLEAAALAAEIAALQTQAASSNRIQALEQERWELQQSIRDRRHYLSTIHPAEAAAVADCLMDIEAHWQRRSAP